LGQVFDQFSLRYQAGQLSVSSYFAQKQKCYQHHHGKNNNNTRNLVVGPFGSVESLRAVVLLVSKRSIKNRRIYKKYLFPATTPNVYYILRVNRVLLKEVLSTESTLNYLVHRAGNLHCRYRYCSNLPGSTTGTSSTNFICVTTVLEYSYILYLCTAYNEKRCFFSLFDNQPWYRSE
jgi:hypothetical protein